jgi:predicted dehydrogenase
MVRIAIVGAGFIGRVHANSYKDIKNAEIVAVADKSRKNGEKLAGELKAKYYSDLDSLLENKDLDGIILTTPQYLHAGMVKKIADAKINVLCEKPLAMNLEDADEMINDVKRNNVLAMTGHAIRFWPEYVKTKEIIDSGELGKPVYGFSQRLAITPDWGEWRYDEKNSGGAALDLHIHDLDFLLWLFGKPKTVKADGISNPDHGGLVHLATSIIFENGVFGLAEGGWEFSGSFPFTMIFRILCERGTVEWSFRAGKNIEERKEKPKLFVYKPDGSIENPEVDQTDAFILEDKYFVDHIEKKQPIDKATFEEGRNTLELALAAIKAVKEGTIVKL